ncbi:MAG: 4-alpha-glucanotransferase [Bacteroidetes bacterium GWE2_42_24]|nr:MAG: 4-alpha-glucanotransferase [Bacteroidetes bacterium GWE2_42_24]OFY32292.1 MAG: 4-alpha-glucanotransferase [Bacteroidetes bacterium GWF2_43_11]PKP26965.1 MAG: 4-alpha-glucanotransferase [Bacteroidetes bacterium HGW-Bacteroidetes-22]
MKVLMFGWEFPPHITGGLGTACYGLTRGLAKHNTDVIFVVPKAFGDEDTSKIRLVNASDIEIDTRESIYHDLWKRIEYMEIGSNIIPYISPEEFENRQVIEELEHRKDEKSVLGRKYEFSGKYGTNLFEEVARYALVASAVAASRDYDLIHAHDWLTYPAGIAAKKVSGKPLVVHIHATEFDRSGERVNQQVYDIEREGMMEADKVIAVSNLTRNICIERYGIPAEKIVTVHNAVEPTGKEELQAGRAVKEKIVTFLGRITYQKGPEYFVEAARKVLDRDPNVRFVMAGQGDLLNKMIKRVAKLHMSSKFHFTGFLRGEEVDRMLAMTDVFVMPSVSEPFGIVPLEAMRSNVPVVISKQSGVSEILKYALKVDFWDVNAMADAIYSLLNYKALPEMFKKYGKEEVDNLKWENAAEQVKAVYDSLFK